MVDDGDDDDGDYDDGDDDDGDYDDDDDDDDDDDEGEDQGRPMTEHTRSTSNNGLITTPWKTFFMFLLAVSKTARLS